MRKLLTPFALFLLAAWCAAGQSFEPGLATQSVDFLGGISDQHPGPYNTNAIIRLRVATCRFASLFGDYSYSRTFSEKANNTTLYRSSLSHWGGGAQLHTTVSRLEPYVLGALGAMRISSKVADGGSYVRSRYELAATGGAGVRVYLHRHFGLSGEFRGVHVNNLGWLTQYSAGAFGTFDPWR